MRAKHWAMFAGWQLAGSLAAMSAHTVDTHTLSWPIYVVMIAPGSFASFYFLGANGQGDYWLKWAPYAIAVGVNVALFTIVALAKRKKVRLDKSAA
jgi:hypothetical protein